MPWSILEGEGHPPPNIEHPAADTVYFPSRRVASRANIQHLATDNAQMDPLTVLPFAMAAGGGSIDGLEAQQLVAAGITLLQRSAPLVRALAGRRAAILLPPSHRFVVALAASEGRGAVLVNPLAAPAEIAFQLRDANVGAVFTSARLATRLPDDVVRVLLDDAPRAARVIANGVAREIDLGSHFAIDLAGEADAPGSDEEAAVVYTSAMAGTPLGARLAHRSLVANARSTVEAAANVADDVVLALLPLSHLFGLTVTLSAPLFAGGRVSTMERFSAIAAAERLAAGDVTEVVGVPSVFAAILASIERRDARGEDAVGALRLCICGGAPLDRELQERWADRTGVELRQGYGLTEAGPVCLFNRVDRPNRIGALGVPFPGVAISIRAPLEWPPGAPRGDRPTAERGPGEIGEICVRGPNVFDGYVGDRGPGLVVRDGWLYTGDLGSADADGSVRFAGLVKPMFTRNGFNIYPREIERALAELPGVERVAVRALPEPARENDIAVTVAGRVDSATVKRWCEARLSAYKQPTVVEIAPS